MPRKGGIISDITTAAIFILLEVAALGILRRNGEFQNLWISNVVRDVNASVWGATEGLRNYFSLKTENERLSEQNFALVQEIRKYRDAQDETLPASRCGKWVVVGGFRYLSAAVVKRSLNSQHNFFLVSKGSSDGVKPGDGVITQKGVIGVVHAVSEKYSYVMSFENTALSVSARIGTDSAVGTLVWTGIGNSKAMLSEIPLHVQFNPGDTVYTSGYSSIFPPDIPLGVTGESKIVNGATHDISVSLFEDYSYVRYVSIASNCDSEEINSLIQQEQ